MNKDDIIMTIIFIGLFAALIIGLFGTGFIVILESQSIDNEPFCNQKGLFYDRGWCYENDGDVRIKLFEVKHKCIDETKWEFSVCDEWEYWGERGE